MVNNPYELKGEILYLSLIYTIWYLLPRRVRYLGVHLFLTNYKAKDFDFVKEIHKAIISSWKCNSLSWIGQATLNKSLAQASLTYAMSVFKPSKGLCEDLDALNRRFCLELCLKVVNNPYELNGEILYLSLIHTIWYLNWIKESEKMVVVKVSFTSFNI